MTLEELQREHKQLATHLNQVLDRLEHVEALLEAYRKDAELRSAAIYQPNAFRSRS